MTVHPLGSFAWLLVAASVLLPSPATAGESAGAAAEPPRQIIYLHGRIVQERQSARPTHPEWGSYELEAILAAFRSRGFDVTGEIRPKATTVSQGADHVVEQVTARLAGGVPPGRLTIVGGSMGASIAFVAAARLQQPELRFVVLGACLSANLKALEAELGRRPAGRFLAFREKSDTLSEPCTPWSGAAPSGATFTAREVVLDTGLHHGFLFRPLPEWLEPTIAFASAR